MRNRAKGKQCATTRSDQDSLNSLKGLEGSPDEVADVKIDLTLRIPKIIYDGFGIM